jgi:hypothetical protein
MDHKSKKEKSIFAVSAEWITQEQLELLPGFHQHKGARCSPLLNHHRTMVLV